MSTTASGVTIPGSSPTTTTAPPFETHWNNLGLSLNGRVVKNVANTTERAAYVTALGVDGYTIAAGNPAIVFRADAAAGCQLEITTDGTTWRPLAGFAQASSSVPTATRAGELWYVTDRFTLAVSTAAGTASWSGLPRVRTYGGGSMLAPRIITYSGGFTPNGAGDVVFDLSTYITAVEGLSFVSMATGAPIVASVVNGTLATYTIRLFNGAVVVTNPIGGILTVIGPA